MQETQLSALPKDANFQSISGSKWHFLQVFECILELNNKNMQIHKKWEKSKIENM